MASEFIQRQKDDFFRDLTSNGSLWFYLIVMLLFLLSKNYAAFRKLALGFILIYAITIIVRSFFFKNRPKRYAYHNYIERLDAASFPSLHASRTSFLSLFLIDYFGSIFISALLIMLALIVLYSRIYLQKHDLKDVVAGIILGILAYFMSYHIL